MDKKNIENGLKQGLIFCKVNKTVQDNFWSVLLDTCCLEKRSAVGFPGIVNAKCLLRKFPFVSED